MDGNEAGAFHEAGAKLTVGGFRVDPGANTIEGPAGAVSIEPKVMDVLLALCARPGEVIGRDALIATVWGVQHGADESLTRAISILRKAFSDGRPGRRAIETFSKRGYRLNLDVSTDAETSSGELASRRQGGVARGGLGIGARTMAGLAATVAAGALLALWVGTSMRGEPEPGVGAVAEVVGEGRFAIAPWASRPGLNSVSETGPRALAAAFSQRGIASVLLSNGQAEGAGQESEFRVTGGVRQRDENLVVSIEVTSVEDGAVVWAGDRVRGGSDGVSLVEGTVAHMANVAECALSARGQYRSTMSNAELAAWMRHCDGVWSGEYDDAYVTAERLAQMSPDEAPAHAALAKAAYVHGSAMEDIADAAIWRARAVSAADRALSLEPENVDSLFVQAALEPFGSWDLVRRAFETVDAGEATTRSIDGALPYFLLRTAGYLDEAWRHAGLRAARSPAPEHLTEEAWLMATAGLSERAINQLNEVIRLYPDFSGAYWRRFNILALHGDLPQAEIALAQAREGLYPGKDAQFPCWEQYLLARLGRIEAEGALSDEACTDIMQEFRARLHGALGQVDQALEYSRRGVEESRTADHRAGTIHLFYPEMGEMRQRPEFWRQADEVGLVDFWMDYGRWPDFCSDRRTPVDCPAMAAQAIEARAG